MKHAIQNGPYCSRIYHQRGRNLGSRSTMLGDIPSAGHAAKPATQGFVLQLYQSGVMDNLNNLLFWAAAVPIATSADVLKYQIPKVHLFLDRYWCVV